MKTKELSFVCLQKSLQEYQTKGDRSEKGSAGENLENGMLKKKSLSAESQLFGGSEGRKPNAVR
jgi:hypothetical protein